MTKLISSPFGRILASTVMGHYHSESYIVFNNGISNRLFAMQVGCGIDNKSYAMAYGKNFSTPHLNCGIVIDGKIPILDYM
jgi:hypothetical protein